MGLKILKTSKYLPSKKVSNNYFEQIMETSDEWIKSRTGIEERRFVEDEDTSNIAMKVSDKFKDEDLSKVDVILVATFTPDLLTPSISSVVQKHLNIKEDVIAFDFNMACSGFVSGLKLMDSLLENNRRGILIGAETISKVLDFNDRKTCILFGDGGAGVLVEKNQEKLHFEIGSRGEFEVLNSIGIKANQDSKSYLKMEGKEVFRFATKVIPENLEKLLDKYKMNIEEIDYFVFHQANKRIIDFVQKKYKLPEEKIYTNLEKYGNTSSASIPLVLDDMNEQNMLKEGDKIFLAGFGGGLAWASTIIKW